ncbi:MAG TPA: hypothetical protein VIW24_21795 [Aldersonia sp.]
MSVLETVVTDRAAVVTMNAARSEFVDGHVVVAVGRIESVGAGPAPRIDDALVAKAC